MLRVACCYFSLSEHLSIQGRNGAERAAGGLQRVSFAFVIRSVIPGGGSQMHSLFHTAAGIQMRTLLNKRGRRIKMQRAPSCKSETNPNEQNHLACMCANVRRDRRKGV